jgi:hypothetical protein
MSRLLTFLLVLSLWHQSFAVFVDGYCYLEGEKDHSGTKVRLIRIGSSATIDSAYTETSGYFMVNLEADDYDVEYTHGCFDTILVPDQMLAEDSTLAPVVLPVSCPSLWGCLSGAMESGYYRVIGNIRVITGDTLRLMPGTHFRFDGRYGFKICGTLLAEGTEDDSIFFTSNIHRNHHNWKGLRFSGSGSSGSHMAYCLIEHADSRIGGLICRRSSPTFIHCTFRDNSANWGGGVLCSSGSPSFENCLITGNRAKYGGGGVYCRHSVSTFTSCAIAENSTEWYGGGLYCRRSSLTFTDCTLTGNRVAWYGGGIYTTDSSLNFTDCTIDGNAAGQHGDRWVRDNSSLILTNCTLQQ